MLGLVIIHHQAGVDDAGNPAGQSQEQAQDETEQAARHEDRDRREDNAKEVAQRFQLRNRNSRFENRKSLPRPRHSDGWIGFFQGRGGIRFAALLQLFLGVDPFGGRVGLRRGRARAAGEQAGADG